MSKYASAQIDRMIGNLIQYGTISAVDGAKAKVKLDDEELETDFISWLVPRAGDDLDWHAHAIGEQVAIAAPSGSLGHAIILGAIYQDAHEPTDTNPDERRVKFADGTVFKYNKSTHTMTIDTSASSGTVIVKAQTATIEAEQTVTIDSPETVCTGNLTVQKSFTMGGAGETATITGNVDFSGGSLTHEGKNIGSTHIHGGVQPGSGNSGDPI